MVRLFAPSVNKLLATAVPPVPPHTNILKGNAPQLLMDQFETILRLNYVKPCILKTNTKRFYD